MPPDLQADRLTILELVDLGYDQTRSLRKRTGWTERRLLRRLAELIAQDLVFASQPERSFHHPRFYKVTAKGSAALSRGVLTSV